MIDTLWIGTTWRRRVTITDEAEDPVTPDPIVACLCPETELTVTPVIGEDGVFDVSLSAADSADLCPGDTHWELMGQVGSDVILLARVDIRVMATCVSLP